VSWISHPQQAGPTIGYYGLQNCARMNVVSVFALLTGAPHPCHPRVLQGGASLIARSIEDVFDLHRRHVPPRGVGFCFHRRQNAPWPTSTSGRRPVAATPMPLAPRSPFRRSNPVPSAPSCRLHCSEKAISDLAAVVGSLPWRSNRTLIAAAISDGAIGRSSAGSPRR
jgi:hypothetical protein